MTHKPPPAVTTNSYPKSGVQSYSPSPKREEPAQVEDWNKTFSARLKTVQERDHHESNSGQNEQNSDSNQHEQGSDSNQHDQDPNIRQLNHGKRGMCHDSQKTSNDLSALMSNLKEGNVDKIQQSLEKMLGDLEGKNKDKKTMLKDKSADNFVSGQTPNESPSKPDVPAKSPYPSPRCGTQSPSPRPRCGTQSPSPSPHPKDVESSASHPPKNTVSKPSAVEPTIPAKPVVSAKPAVPAKPVASVPPTSKPTASVSTAPLTPVPPALALPAGQDAHTPSKTGIKNMDRWDSQIEAASISTGLPANYIKAVIWAESRGNPDDPSQNPDGQHTDLGVMQISNYTYGDVMKSQPKAPKGLNASKPADNIMMGAWELRDKFGWAGKNQSYEKTSAAYRGVEDGKDNSYGSAVVSFWSDLNHNKKLSDSGNW